MQKTKSKTKPKVWRPKPKPVQNKKKPVFKSPLPRKKTIRREIRMDVQNAMAENGRAIVAIKKATRINGDAASIARWIMLPGPGESNPTRFSGASMTNAIATAILPLRDELPISFPTNSFNMPVTDTVAFQFRNPLRSKIVYKKNPGAQDYVYDMYFTASDQSEAGSVPSKELTINPTEDVGEDSNGGMTPAPLVYLEVNTDDSGWQPHGKRYYAGDLPDNDGRFFWLDVDAKGESRVQITCVGGIGLVGTLSARLACWSNGTYQPIAVGDYVTGTAPLKKGEVEKKTILHPSLLKIKGGHQKSRHVELPQGTPATALSLYPEFSGYYALHVFYTQTGDDVTAFTVQAISAGGYDSFAHLCLPELEANEGLIQGYKCHGAALHYSNSSNEQDKNGYVYPFQSPASVPWQSWAYGGTQFVTEKNQCQEMLAAKGSYMYLKPSGIDDLTTWQRPFSFSGTNNDPTRVSYPIIPESDYGVTYLTVPGALGQVGKWIHTVGFEYQSASRWVETKMPIARDEDWSKALRAIASAPQVFENPLHLKDIANSIKKGIRFADDIATRYGAPLLEFAKRFAN
jgi:hypothetical protein